MNDFDANLWKSVGYTLASRNQARAALLAALNDCDDDTEGDCSYDLDGSLVDASIGVRVLTAMQVENLVRLVCKATSPCRDN